MIELRGVSKSFGGLTVIDNVSLRVESGAFFVLIGPSGCGKSTLLRMINAMIDADRGAIELRGRDLAAMDKVEARRSVGYVIQSVGLFPHWTVERNIGAVLELLGWDRARAQARISEIAAQMQIDPALFTRYPRQLSGGQQQRVGVARALAADPDIVLMDEPFAALDPISRASLQEEMRRLHAQSGRTFVFVTHDMDEALRLATRIGVMNKGRLVQTGAPAEILTHPKDDFVRAFFGREALRLGLLDFIEVRARLKAELTGQTPVVRADPRDVVAARASLKEALTMMLERGVGRLAVKDDGGQVIGDIGAEDIVAGRDVR